MGTEELGGLEEGSEDGGDEILPVVLMVPSLSELDSESLPPQQAPKPGRMQIQTAVSSGWRGCSGMCFQETRRMGLLDSCHLGQGPMTVFSHCCPSLSSYASQLPPIALPGRICSWCLYVCVGGGSERVRLSHTEKEFTIIGKIQKSFLIPTPRKKLFKINYLQYILIGDLACLFL